MSSPIESEPSCPIPRFLTRSHPAHATPIHSSFENHYHIASFTIAFTDMNRRRGGAKPFRLCFTVDTCDVDGTNQQHQVCFDGKLYAHKAFSNQYQHYQRGRFGCTMLTPELGYIVSGTVKNVEKDMVMMNMFAPHDTRHYWINDNIEINEHTQLNMKHMQNPAYALSVGATYTVSFYSIHRTTTASYVATLTDHNSLAVSCEMLPYSTIPTAAAHSLAQARRKKPAKLTIPSPPSMGTAIRIKTRHQTMDLHADLSHTPSSPASSESSGASSPSSSHQYSSDSTPSSPPSQLSRISSTSSSITSPIFTPTSSEDIQLKWNQLQHTRHLMSIASQTSNVALTFYTSAPVIIDDISMDEMPTLKRKLSLEMISHDDTDDMIWPITSKRLRMETNFDLDGVDVDGMKTQPLFMSDVTTNNFYHDSDFLL